MIRIPVFVPRIPKSKNWNDPVIDLDLALLQRGDPLPNVPFLDIREVHVSKLDPENEWDAKVLDKFNARPKSPVEDAGAEDKPSVTPPKQPKQPKKAKPSKEPETVPAVTSTETDNTDDDHIDGESSVVADGIESQQAAAANEATAAGEKLVADIRAKVLASVNKKTEGS